jgi:uncharacterized membrane protein
MQDFLYFLGRFHVLALHLPIGILVVAVILDWVARGERYRALARVAPFLWTATAISALLTAVLGYMRCSEGGFTGVGECTRFFGTLAAFSVLVCGSVRAARSLSQGQRSDGDRRARARDDHRTLRR